MDLYAPIARHVIAPLWAKWEHSAYLQRHRELLHSQYLPAELLRERQRVQLTRLLQHAYLCSPFYRRRFNEAGIMPDDIRELEDLRMLPALTKADLRESFHDIVCMQEGGAGVWTKTTSGSTGTKVKVLVDDASGQFKRACTLRADEWSGWRLGEKVAAIWGNPEYRKSFSGHLRNILLERRSYLDTLSMSEDDIVRYARHLQKWRPSLLFGHAHSVYLFAQTVKNLNINDICPRGIITTAMVLHESERNEIEDVFGCKVTNRYGCEEVSLIACECAQHKGLHITAESLYVEFSKKDGFARPGEEGAILLTDLTNYAMPLIRYEVGDVGVPARERCACGRTLPLIERVEGRVADYIYTPDGRLISGISLTENFACIANGIGQLQLIQDQRDHILLKIVRGDDFSDDSMQRITGLVRERFGPEMRYSVEFVATIPKEPSGKYRFCISKIPNPLVINLA